MRSVRTLCYQDKPKKPSTEQENAVDKKGGILPRRCAVIRQTFPKEGVEKTEFRFVIYKRPSGPLDKQGFLDEIDQFLKEQVSLEATSPANTESMPLSSWMEETSNTPVKTATPKTGSSGRSNPSYASGKTTPSLSEESSKAMEAHHHAPKCTDADGIRKALPLIEELVAYFRTLEKNTGRKDIGAMRETSELILKDAHKSLIQGGRIAKGLVDRVRALNDLANKTRCSGLSPVPSSSLNLSLSNVNAGSNTDRI